MKKQLLLLATAGIMILPAFIAALDIPDYCPPGYHPDCWGTDVPSTPPTPPTLPQKITFGPLSEKLTTDAPFTVSATSDQRLTVLFSSLTTSICTVSDTTVTLTGTAGTCTIRASQPGMLSTGAAPDVDQSFEVFAPKGIAQTITFEPIPAKTVDSPDFDLVASSDSGLPVTFSVSSFTTHVCSVTDKTVHIKGAGSCTIFADSAAGSIDGKSYNSAEQTSQRFNVSKLRQDITITPIDDQVLSEENISIEAVSNADDLELTFGAEGACSLADGDSEPTVHLDTFGTCTVSASSEGNARYDRAFMDESFEIGDNDGTSNATEDDAPNRGDGNGDGTADSLQENVVSSPDEELDGDYVTMALTAAPSNPKITSFTTNPKVKLKEKPGVFLPVGGFGFTAKGSFEGPITVKFIFDTLFDTRGWTLKKYKEGALVDGPEATFSTVNVGGHNKTQVQYSITDNGPFDEDPTVGTVTDPVFPVVPVIPPVPPAPPAAPAPVVSGGNGPIAGSLTSPVVAMVMPTQTGRVLGVSTTTVTTTSTTPILVIGTSTPSSMTSSCGEYITTTMRIGHRNDAAEVKKLQIFLNKELGTSIPVTGFFGVETDKAVRRLQSEHASEILTPQDLTAPTGIVLNYTRAYINKRECESKTNN